MYCSTGGDLLGDGNGNVEASKLVDQASVKRLSPRPHPPFRHLKNLSGADKKVTSFMSCCRYYCKLLRSCVSILRPMRFGTATIAAAAAIMGGKHYALGHVTKRARWGMVPMPFRRQNKRPVGNYGHPHWLVLSGSSDVTMKRCCPRYLLNDQIFRRNKWPPRLDPVRKGMGGKT